MSFDNDQWQQPPADEPPMRQRSQQPQQSYPYAPVPPQQFAPYQSAQPKRRHRGRNITLGAVGGLIAVIIIGAVASGGKSAGTPAAAVTTAATPSTHAAAAPAATAAQTAQAAPVEKVVLQLTGSSSKTTQSFTTGNDWSIKYSFDCSSFGDSGNFQVYVYTDDDLSDVPVNALAAKGSDTTYEHGSAGSHYLEMNSECSWTVTVTDGA